MRLTARDPVARRAQTPREGGAPGVRQALRVQEGETPDDPGVRAAENGLWYARPTRTTRGSSTCATTTAASSAAAGTRATPRATASSRVRTETLEAGRRRAAGTASTRRSAAPPVRRKWALPAAAPRQLRRVQGHKRAGRAQADAVRAAACLALRRQEEQGNRKPSELTAKHKTVLAVADLSQPSAAVGTMPLAPARPPPAPPPQQRLASSIMSVPTETTLALVRSCANNAVASVSAVAKEAERAERDWKRMERSRRWAEALEASATLAPQGKKRLFMQLMVENGITGEEARAEVLRRCARAPER